MDLEVLSIAANTDNNRNIEKKTHVSKLKNSLCGDEMKIELIMKNKKILDSSIGFIGAGMMGAPMIYNLTKKFSNVFVFDTDQTKLKEFESNKSNILIGTHALLSLKFSDMYLIVALKKSCLIGPLQGMLIFLILFNLVNALLISSEWFNCQYLSE